MQRELGALHHWHRWGRNRCGIGLAGRRTNIKAQRKAETTAHTQFALHLQRPTHKRHQPLADSQPQAGATKTARGGGFRLAEALQHKGQFVCRNANASVLHGKRQFGGFSGRAHHCHAQPHIALGRKFQGIAHQINQHLAQPQSVTHQRGGHLGV